VDARRGALAIQRGSLAPGARRPTRRVWPPRLDAPAGERPAPVPGTMSAHAATRVGAESADRHRLEGTRRMESAQTGRGPAPPAPSAPPVRQPERGSGLGVGGPWTVFRVRGVPVRVDGSWFLVAGLVVFLAYGRYTALLGDLGTGAVLLAAASYAVLFFASILLHELGHAFASLDRDIPVAGITLFALGGVTESTREATRARDEFVIVGIGPFVSLVLAGVLGLLFIPVEAYRVPAAMLGFAAWTNLGLAIFNTVPGYPLDGGRLLRSIIWGATGRPHLATRWAARVGQVFALGLIALVIAPFLGLRPPISLGLLNVFIAMFLFRGATDAHRRASTRERLTARTARQVMGAAPQPLPPQTTVGAAIAAVRERPSLLWPVGNPLLGSLTLAHLEAVPDRLWEAPVTEVLQSTEATTVDADADMETVFDRMMAAPGNMLLVLDDGRVAGLITPSLVVGLVR